MIYRDPVWDERADLLALVATVFGGAIAHHPRDGAVETLLHHETPVGRLRFRLDDRDTDHHLGHVPIVPGYPDTDHDDAENTRRIRQLVAVTCQITEVHLRYPPPHRRRETSP